MRQAPYHVQCKMKKLVQLILHDQSSQFGVYNPPWSESGKPVRTEASKSVNSKYRSMKRKTSKGKVYSPRSRPRIYYDMKGPRNLISLLL